MLEKRIKVVWVCHFSDEKTRAHILFSRFYYKWLVNLFKRRAVRSINDMSVWVTNAIREFEKFEDVELTVVFPHIAIEGKMQEFTINGVHYKCYRSEDDYLIPFLINRLLHRKSEYKKNRMLVKRIIEHISPDIVHVIGAENPYYSITALDIPHNLPLVVSLQTLMSDPDFYSNYPVSASDYKYRSEIESCIIKRSDYIASPYKKFNDIIKQRLKQDAIFLNMNLALGQEIDLTPTKKEFDFVYFAADISKACDYAIESFALACKKYSSLTLNVSGRYTSQYKNHLDRRLQELGISEKVFFTGPKETHEEVLYQIKKSRFALLPLKVDLISGTIREAMACGLPVVSTITSGTPELNKDRESILLSEQGDYESMANNMIRLLKDNYLAKTIRENGILTISEKYSNLSFMKTWRKGYYEIIENFHNRVDFSKDILL